MATSKKAPILPGSSSKKRTEDEELNRQSARLVRYNLGGISVEDLMDPEHDPAGDGDGRRQYVAHIHGMMETLRLEIKRAIALQLDFNSRFSENWDQIVFGRGGINDMEALLERWEALSLEHLQNIDQEKKDEKPFDKFKTTSDTE